MRLVVALLLFAATAAPTTMHAQWDMEESNTTASLRGIVNVGGGVAWASGTNGTVLRSEDGGYLWQSCATPPGAEKLDFRGIQAFDENTAIVMSSGKGDLSRLYKTTDGCATWKLLFTNPDKEGFWDAVQFGDKTHGFLLGDPVNDLFRLWTTLDAGETWLEVRKYSTPNVFDRHPQGAFAASNSALWVTAALWSNGSYNPYLAWATGGKNGAKVYAEQSHGDHGGGSISSVPLGHKTESSGAFSLFFREDVHRESVGVVVGGDYLNPNDNTNTAAVSPDSGTTWTAAQTPPHGYRSAVAYNSKTKTWITVGPNGTDISRDDGKNWTPLKPSGYDAADADKNWNALSLPFVVGPNGRIGKLRAIAISTAESSKDKKE